MLQCAEEDCVCAATTDALPLGRCGMVLSGTPTNGLLRAVCCFPVKRETAAGC